jgi:hypothetical protein
MTVTNQLQQSPQSTESLLENLRYLSESAKEFQRHRFSTIWSVYLSLLGFYSLSAGAAISTKFVPHAPINHWICVSYGILCFIGIVFLFNTQHSNDKNQEKYTRADLKIVEILVESGGLQGENPKDFAGEMKKGLCGTAARWLTTILMWACLVGFASGSAFIITMDK